MKNLLVSILLGLSLATASAQIPSDCIAGSEERPARPVTQSIMMGGGTSTLTDTYLSPFKTTGWNATIGFERIQALRANPRRMSFWLAAELSGGRTHNAMTANGAMWRGVLHLEAAPLWRFNPAFFPLKVAIGPQLSVDAGVHYRPANGNNPVSAQASVAAAASAHIIWPVSIRRMPVTIGYNGSISLLGVFFAPEYGELYYEIYLGDRKGLANMSWIGNKTAYRHLIYADLHFGATALRIGYSMNLLSQAAHHQSTNLLTNTFMIGITTTRLSLNPGSIRNNPNIQLGL